MFEQQIKYRRFLPGFASLIVLLLLLIGRPHGVSAQVLYGTLTGSITDSSGAVVPNIPVTVTNEATAETRTTNTDSSGNYRFVNMLPAAYTIAVNPAETFA